MTNYSISSDFDFSLSSMVLNISSLRRTSSISRADSLRCLITSPISPSRGIPSVTLSTTAWYVARRPSQRNSTVVLKCCAMSKADPRSGSRLFTLHPVSVWYGLSIAEAISLSVSLCFAMRKFTLAQKFSVRKSICSSITQIIVLILLYVNIETYIGIFIQLNIDKQQYILLNKNKDIAI